MSDEAEEETPLRSFVFDRAKAVELARDFALRIEAIEERVDRISKNTQVKGFQVLQPLLQLSSDPEDISRMAKALEKLAPLMSELQQYKAKFTALEMADKEFNWLAAQVGDFSNEMTDIDSFFTAGEDS